MIIKQGKVEGWLHIDAQTTQKWLESCGVQFEASSPTAIAGKGNTLVATKDLQSLSSQPPPFLTVPVGTVLSQEAVKAHAQYDQDFRDVLESLGEFGQSPRGAILSFLLFQASLSCPHLPERVGVRCEFTDYVKSLPCEYLPTFWSADEREALVGTTLAPAISSKLNRLHGEYDSLCSAVVKTRWYRVIKPFLDFEDWLHVDAMFRSRALEFHGSCMIPGMDLASHAAGEATNSFYDKADGTYQLWLIGGKEIKNGEEVTITYGDEKGACEMLFSYGFIDDNMCTAETLFLNLLIPEEDKFHAAKNQTADCAPGFKIIDVSVDGSAQLEAHKLEASKIAAIAQRDGCVIPDASHSDGAKNVAASSHEQASSGAIDWKGDFIWYLVVHEEDGLRFELSNTTDGKEEVQASFCNHHLEHGAADLRRILAKTDLWDVYRLRALVILQSRVYEQLQILYQTQDLVEAVPRGDGTNVSERAFQLAMRLRKLEFDLLERAYEDFEVQKIELANSAVVQRYLAEMRSESSESDPKADVNDSPDDDFA